MTGRLVLACVRCHLVGGTVPATVVDGAHSYCDDHAPPPKARHLRLVPFCGDDLAHGLTDGWVR